MICALKNQRRRCHSACRSRSTRGNRQETRWIALAPQSSSASIELDFKPETLRLDPEIHVWRRLTAGQLPPVLREWIGASAPRLLNAAASPEEIVAVNQLSGRIFETAPKALDMAGLANALTGKQPVLIAGTHGSIDKIIAKAGLPRRPASPSRPRHGASMDGRRQTLFGWLSFLPTMPPRSARCNAAFRITADRAG